ncbi:hypothetical protein ILUMI_12760 [Ignelater luminosus]|uniref:Sphingomyelin phosphodiesterase n=1 Tax=Ignelater luminosus TaxID=2038154 RepID=A0A8K0GC13_IGNLU|nr:hypothetical protein ILUMI_12760 [Ignelater luminosus]
MMRWTALFKLILLTLIGSYARVREEDELINSLRHGLEDYLKTGARTKELNHTLERLQVPNLFLAQEKGLLSKAACLACHVGIGVAIHARRRGAEKGRILDIVEKLCFWLRIESEHICHAAVAIYGDSLVYIADNRQDLTSKRMCSILLQDQGCRDPDRIDWTIDIPSPKYPSSGIEKKRTKSTPLKVLHLTDIHYDPGYEVGANAECGSYLCCQRGTKPSNRRNSAGYWSDYRNCDVPWHMFTDTLDHITAQHRDLDFVYFTGDIINHKVWESNIPCNTKAITDIMLQLKKSFGTIPVYPVLGNHEPHPINLFSPKGVDHPQLTSQWVFDLSARLWKAWLPIETHKSILHGGFYTTLIKPGIRIIGLNSNFCYIFNWWLFLDDFDLYGQLEWLVKVLLEAEENNEVVHIISHIPNGDTTCLYNWSKEYSKIVNRFSHIIAAQFNGHTHYDETMIFFNNTNPEQAINVAFNGGSLTTWPHLNPNYKIYYVDSDSGEVLDYETWTFNVTAANLTPHISPSWYKLYSFKHTYGVNNLSPQELAALTVRMARTPYLTNLYFRYKYREADTTLAKGCNNECQINNLCTMVTSHPEQTLHCEILTEIYNSSRQ